MLRCDIFPLLARIHKGHLRLRHEIGQLSAMIARVWSFRVVWTIGRIYKALKVHSAKAAGVTDGFWSRERIAELIKARRPASAKRGFYKPRISK